jgi:hypothetical protein
VTGLRGLLWQPWSPNWHFDDATFARTAVSFDSLDFVAPDTEYEKNHATS